MAISFEHIEECGFFGNEDIRCDVYEWSLLNPSQTSPFKIRFLSPREDRARRFFIVPVLRCWYEKNDVHDRTFLNRACDVGRMLLAELPRARPYDADVHRVLAAIFRQRDVGHLYVGRMFTSAMDFFDFAKDKPYPTFIAPGLEDVGEGRAKKIATKLGTAKANVYKATGERGGGAAAVRDWYEALFQEAMQDASGQSIDRYFDLISLMDAIDPTLRLYTNGRFRRNGNYNFRFVSEKVYRSLISGPSVLDELEEDGSFPGMEEVLEKLVKKSHASSDADFDKWYKDASEHRFLRLVHGGTRLKGADKEAAQDRVKKTVRYLIWLSYQQMARCYGALMRLVLSQFAADELLQPTIEEKMLFVNMHLPQMYLAGLPLAFLGRAQMNWIANPLVSRWNQGLYLGDDYDVITELLGAFGVLVSERRQVDRRSKSIDISNEGRAASAPPHRGHKPASADAEGVSDDDDADTNDREPAAIQSVDEAYLPMQIERFRSIACEKCGTKYELKGRLQVPDTNGCICFSVYCPKCEKTVDMQSTAEELGRFLAG